ncbi:MAG: hypothetical protein AAF727_12065 [Pseudomonadota bacterium]
MATIDIHPAEFAYAFAYAKVQSIIGWGDTPFLPGDSADGAAWGAQGEALLRSAGRLVGEPETGLNFSDEMTAAIMALIDPGLVLSSERKAGEGVRRLTVHAKRSDFIGLIQRDDGMFEMTRYTDLTAGAGACAAFAGASLAPLAGAVRVDVDHKTLVTLHKSARSRRDDVIAALVSLGFDGAHAASATDAFADPASSGLINVFYCAGNAVKDAEPISVMTTQEGQTWTIFPPASLDGPMVLECSSVAALTARIAVMTAARLGAGR